MTEEGSGAQAAVAVEPTDDDGWAARYEALRDGFAAGGAAFSGAPGSPEFAAVTAELRAMGEKAQDAHLRANAAVLLGAIYQAHGRLREATAAFRRADGLISDDAGPSMALATVLAEQGAFADAAAAQVRATQLDPDNLEQYLTLGQLWTRAGDAAKARSAYAAYEVRRKGLIDGLTLGVGGTYRLGVEERIRCAEALASTTDVGTANALIYALASDPDATVRAAVARAMGVTRLVHFKAPLRDALAKVLPTEVELRGDITWALAEIDRAPVELDLTPPSADKPK